jgi:4a-hydroxytetrahydrobiopterin dehydratase
MPPNEEIKRDVEELGGDGWELKDDKLVKSFQFSSFVNAIEFVNSVANIAEKVNHHPIIKINWRTVKLSLKSFDVNALTKRDINLAKAITDNSKATRSETY